MLYAMLVDHWANCRTRKLFSFLFSLLFFLPYVLAFLSWAHQVHRITLRLHITWSSLHGSSYPKRSSIPWLCFSFKIPLHVFAFHYHAPQRTRKNDYAKPEVFIRLFTVVGLSHHGEFFRRAHRTRPYDEEVRRERTAHALKYFMYSCHFGNVREKKSRRPVRGPMSGRHPTSANKGWHKRSHLTARDVQIAALFPSSRIFSSFPFLPSSSSLKELSVRASIFLVAGKYTSFMLLEAPLCVFCIARSMLAERGDRGVQ